MQRLPHGIVIRVRNLELCRAFYRDILDLGSPVMDSNFWVEFKVSDSMSLILEKLVPSEPDPTPNGAISWIFRTDDVENIVERLRKYGYNPMSDTEERAGFKTLRFLDPEGNMLLVGRNNPPQ